MELTPQLLTDEIDFRIAVRGYDRHEVDDFLERVAVAVGQLQAQLTKAVDRARKAEARLEAGADTDETPVQEAEAATETVAEETPERPRGAGAPPPAAPGSRPVEEVDPEDELRRTLVLAQRTADMAIREAREEATAIRAEADEDAERIRAEAEAEAAQAREEARGRLIVEIRELEQTRETMRTDTEVLERYLGTERARVRETIQVLRRLVDEPERFRPATPPELSAVTAPRELGVGDGPDADQDPTPDTDGPQAETTGETPDGAAPTDQDATAEVDATPEGPETGEDAGAPTEATASEPTAATAVEPAGDAIAEPDEAPDDSERLGQLFDAADGPRDWRTSGPDRGDQGPHTQPVAAARFEEESDEAFLAELRRAMTDDEPLGPGQQG